ncbi:hypothetical protein [Paenibacillus alkalitolerans]|uniref:hypothetical protein n=1 Tax=Paenibacillus alkalitolerans TaxID=2799335 RepID=UPI0018F79CFF|nr:hypothetical protein [Paenibacillus alkalitolerans]
MTIQLTPEAAYDEIVRILSQDPEVTTTIDHTKKRFGSSGELKYAGKMFAFHHKGRLIVKLPKPQVDALISTGKCETCVMGRGRAMKEWVVIGASFQSEWLSLASESKSFVSGKYK